jgi:hypothetical protein
MLHPLPPVGAQVIVAQTVGLDIDDRLQPRLQSRPLRRIDLDFENGKLHPLAKILTGPRHTAQAPRASPDVMATS